MSTQKMTRRDHMAAAAMQGILASPNAMDEFRDLAVHVDDGKTTLDHAAEVAVEVADALIKALDE